MPFILHPFAAVKDKYVVRFIDEESDILEGEIALPVVADPDPSVGPDERIWGPDFEVMEDKVRAYGRALPMEPDELLANRIKRLDELIAALEAKVV